jgi:hypothetical protein
VSEARVKPAEKNEMKMRDDRVTVPMSSAKFRFYYPDGSIKLVRLYSARKVLAKLKMLEQPKAIA